MKVILKFNLPEDRDELTLAQKGSDFYCAIHEFDQQYLRTKIKYDETVTDEQLKIYQDIRDKLYTCLQEHNIDLYGMVE